MRNLLRQWVVEAPLPPRFQEQVWTRIERAATRPADGFWSRLAQQLEAWVPRPRFAVAYLSLFLVVGLAAGAVAAQRKTTKLDSELSRRYVQSIDPYLAENSHP